MPESTPSAPTPDVQQEKPLVKALEQPSGSTMTGSLKTALIIVIILVAGTLSGWGVSALTKGKSSLGVGTPLKSSDQAAQAGVKVGDIVGVPDEKSFKDSAEGVLVAGGAEGEGSHHILRVGGPSQNVYLTSSVVDLDLFVGDKVQVWGETFSAQKAGWLMDVGRVKVQELNSTPPFQEELGTTAVE